MNEWKFSGYFALMTPEYLQVVDKENYFQGHPGFYVRLYIKQRIY